MMYRNVRSLYSDVIIFAGNNGSSDGVNDSLSSF